jgi:phospholipase C
LVTDSAGDKNVSWRYYTPSTGVIWNAPEAIPEVCYGENSGYTVQTPCTATEFTSHVVLPNQNGYNGAPILTDISNCSLAKISWVIPDEAWSDHPFNDVHNSPPYGPSWVGDIINAIGKSYTTSNGQCDYWGISSPTPEPTAIFVVWDDWGGFYDHVTPPAVYEGTPTSCPSSVQPNGWGCGYVYGMRVPLLVVSAYTKAGYVSGALPSPGKVFPYVHDFGSVLTFVENNFGLPNIDQSGRDGYADLNAPDNQKGNIPLSDFFSTSYKRTFTQISTPYPPGTFQSYYTTPQNGVYPTPTGPDGGPGEEDY